MKGKLVSKPKGNALRDSKINVIQVKVIVSKTCCFFYVGLFSVLKMDKEEEGKVWNSAKRNVYTTYGLFTF